MTGVSEDAIRDSVGAFAGTDAQVASQANGAPEMAWGDTFFIYDPDRNLEGPGRFPFATIVTQDYGDFDNLSKLNRPSVFRLNVGVSKETFRAFFPNEGEHEFAALDQLMPHPVYGKNHWISVLNPSEATFERVKPLLGEAYEIAKGRIERKRIGRDGGA